MGKLQQYQGTRVCLLEPEHLVGRAPMSALLLRQSYVSAQHALLRWNGDAWEIIDRGSRNGTHLDGVALEPGLPRVLHVRACLSFGHRPANGLASTCFARIGNKRQPRPTRYRAAHG